VGEAETVDREVQADGRFAWLTLLLATWILGGGLLAVYALFNGLTTDVGMSPYHLLFFSGILALGAFCLLLVTRAVRAGRPWHRAFPRGYGSLGLGALLLVAWPIVDIGWREGVGINEQSIEGPLAPSRLLIPIGLTLVAVGPLRAAMRSTRPVAGRWAIVASGALVVTVVGFVGFQPAQSPLLETAVNPPDDDLEIWVMDSDGSHQTRLIEAADGYEPDGPAWSPDGTEIAYTRIKSSERVGRFCCDDIDIWLAAADGSQRRPLVVGPDQQWLPHWSPDGDWIVYTIDPPGGVGENVGPNAPVVGPGQGPGFDQPQTVANNADLWRVRADGTGAPERLTDDPADDRAGAYSPDGLHILFDSTREEGRTGVYVMDPDGSNVVRVTFQGDDWGASWSPDGTRIAYHSSPTGEGADIYVTPYPESGSPPLRLTDDPSNDMVPNWSPDGARIAFMSGRGDRQEIWSMAADGSDIQNLTRTVSAGESLTLGGEAWGPDGRILYERASPGPAWTDRLVREDLGVAGTLFAAIMLAIVIVVLIGLRAPFGAVAVVMGASTIFGAIANDGWRFLPAAIIGGLIVDLLVRLAPPAWKASVGGAGAAAMLVLSAGATVIFTTGLGWTPTLLLGVTMACAAIGWGIGALIGRPIGPEPKEVGE
jgi:Tol biopolymer transport system component